MVRSFNDQETAKLFARLRPRVIPAHLERHALRKLLILDGAEVLDDLRPGAAMERTVIAPIHPGEILLEEFLEPMQLSQYRLAQGLKVPPRRINEIVHGKRAITADTALRLARFFGTSERFWLNLQTRFDLETQRERLGSTLEQEVEVYRHAS